MVSICATCGEVNPVCPTCGAQVSRALGTGRIPKPGAKPKAFRLNHAALLEITRRQPDHWFTVREYQYLLEKDKVPHHGRRNAWNYVAVQWVLSDLVGVFNLLKMAKSNRGLEYVYKLRADRNAGMTAWGSWVPLIDTNCNCQLHQGKKERKVVENVPLEQISK